MHGVRQRGRRRDKSGEQAISARHYTALLLPIALCAAAFAQDEASGDNDTLRFEGYPDAPEFDVVLRKDELFFYPCDQCHAAMEPNPEIRELDAIHDAEMEHGRGRIWCLSCHALEDRNYLRTLLDEPVDFDEAYLVCGGCHSGQHRDWIFGAHGKRVADWQGERTLYSCTHCHNPHSPAIEPRAPKPPPPVRAGLKPQHRSGDGHTAPHSNEEQPQQ